jgi:hypothetical protein
VEKYPVLAANLSQDVDIISTMLKFFSLIQRGFQPVVPTTEA